MLNEPLGEWLSELICELLGAGNMQSVSQSLSCALELGTEQEFFFLFFLVLCLISRQGTPASGLIDVFDTTHPTVSSCTIGPGSWPAVVWTAGKRALLPQGCRATRTQAARGFLCTNAYTVSLIGSDTAALVNIERINLPKFLL